MSLSKISAFERLFDRSASLLLVALGVILAGATAVSGV